MSRGARVLRPCVTWFVFSSSVLVQRAGCQFYPYVNEPNCTFAMQWTRAPDLIAGSMGFFGAFGDDGPATLARFRMPRALALDESNQMLYISDSANHAVRVVNLSSTIITTVAGVLGQAGASGDGRLAVTALLREPNGLVIRGRQLFIADQGNHAVRMLNLLTGIISTVAGQLGVPGNSASPVAANQSRLSSPNGLALDNVTGVVFIADSGNRKVWRLVLATSVLIDVAPAAVFAYPAGLGFDVFRQLLYIADRDNDVIVRLNLSQANATQVIIAGSSSPEAKPLDIALAVNARLRRPEGLVLDALAQRLYFTDASTSDIRVVDLPSGNITIQLARPGLFGNSQPDYRPFGLAISQATVPGFRVGSTWYNPLEGGPTVFGRFFYFNAGGLNTTGVRRVLQFRKGVLVWTGYVSFLLQRYGIGPFKQSNPDLDSTGIRWPHPIKPWEITFRNQWEVDDMVMVPDYLNGRVASQILYLAEGDNLVVRQIDIAMPIPSFCSNNSAFPIGLRNITGIDNVPAR